MLLLMLLIALYGLLGAALTSFIAIWLVMYRLGGGGSITSGSTMILAPTYRRRLTRLAQGRRCQVMGRLSKLALYALLAWPWLFLELFYEKK